MSSTREHLLARAASCYQQVGETAEAARCYRAARADRRAAELLTSIGRHHDAAEDYARADLNDVGSWLLVDRAGDPAAARRQLASGGVPDGEVLAPLTGARLLRTRLVTARCDVAEERSPRFALDVLAQATNELAKRAPIADPYVERWAVAVAQALDRHDQVALLFAAAVLGRRSGAAKRWAAWSERTLNSPLILPPDTQARVASRVAPGS